MHDETRDPGFQQIALEELEHVSGGVSKQTYEALSAILIGMSGPLAPILVVAKTAADLTR